MKKRMLPIMLLAGVSLLATSCGPTSSWNWAEASEDGDLSYALLIGQIDHNDSAARTKGIREALNTNPVTPSTNANSDTPKVGSIKVDGKDYTVTEVEHQEMRATSGATWDSQTATSTTQTWLNKHSNIDFFVSNNDGMAEGAIGASNWKTGTPIFGYDSNASTLKFVDEGKIMGTVNQDAPAQAASIFMLARNLAAGKSGNDAISEGFTKASTLGYGDLASEVVYNEAEHAIKVNNFAITKDNVSGYLDKDTPDLLDKGIKAGTNEKIKIWMSIYSNTDTFLQSTMLPLFKAYESMFNLSVNYTYGNGNDEQTTLSNITSSEAGSAAYLVNMVQTTNGSQVLDAIYAKEGKAVPVIFWNRQPTKADNTVDTSTMTDARFSKDGESLIYYVGFDAIQGGQIQGKMIADYLKAQK